MASANNRLDILTKIVREAGKYMLGSDDRHKTQKSNVKDFVTVADIKAQSIIIDLLNKHFPDVPAVSEEHSEEARKALLEPGFTGYVIDPIDGTYNFKRDMRESAISIGYVENGEPVAGVVFDPYRDELYAAEKGKGATRNGKSIHVSDQTELRGSSVATSNGYDDAAAARNFKRHVSIYELTGVMPWSSCPGSAILVLVWIACGRIDAMHHNGFKPWDCAAAFVILEEAGADIYDLKCEPTTYTNKSILVGTPKIVDQLKEVFLKLPSNLLG